MYYIGYIQAKGWKGDIQPFAVKYFKCFIYPVSLLSTLLNLLHKRNTYQDILRI